MKLVLNHFPFWSVDLFGKASGRQLTRRAPFVIWQCSNFTLASWLLTFRQKGSCVIFSAIMRVPWNYFNVQPIFSFVFAWKTGGLHDWHLCSWSTTWKTTKYARQNSCLFLHMFNRENTSFAVSHVNCIQETQVFCSADKDRPVIIYCNDWLVMHDLLEAYGAYSNGTPGHPTCDVEQVDTWLRDPRNEPCMFPIGRFVMYVLSICTCNFQVTVHIDFVPQNQWFSLHFSGQFMKCVGGYYCQFELGSHLPTKDGCLNCQSPTKTVLMAFRLVCMASSDHKK